MITIVLGCILGAAATVKAARPRTWVASLEGYRLGPFRRIAPWAVPAAEAAVSGLCIFGPPRLGAAAGLLLLVAFGAAILLARQSRLPCGCFGGRKERSRSYLLVRNGMLAVLASAALIWPDVGGELGTAEVLPAALVGLGVAAAVLTVQTTRQAMKQR